jgi:hypothetical protein
MHRDWSKITARHVWRVRLFRGRRCHAAGFALSRPCIATDNSKGEHCYYISQSYSEEASDDTSVLWNLLRRNCRLVTAA